MFSPQYLCAATVVLWRKGNVVVVVKRVYTTCCVWTPVSSFSCRQTLSGGSITFHKDTFVSPAGLSYARARVANMAFCFCLIDVKMRERGKWSEVANRSLPVADLTSGLPGLQWHVRCFRSYLSELSELTSWWAQLPAPATPGSVDEDGWNGTGGHEGLQWCRD